MKNHGNWLKGYQFSNFCRRVKKNGYLMAGKKLLTKDAIIMKRNQGTNSLITRKVFLMAAFSLVGLTSISTNQVYASPQPTTITVDTPTPGVRIRLVCLTRNIIVPPATTTWRPLTNKNQANFELTRWYQVKLPKPDVWIMQYWNGSFWVTWVDNFNNSQILMNMGSRRSLVIRKI